ncbi:glycosyltransferase family 4 protein [Vibrio astriarenae]
MKLLFVVNVDWFFVSHRLPIALEATKKGYEVHIACVFTSHREYLEQLGLVCHDVNFSRSGGSLFKELKSVILVRNLISSLKIDIVHAVTIKPVIYTGIALRTMSQPPVFVAAISGLGYVFTASNVRAQLTKQLVSWLYCVALRHENKKIIFQNTSDQAILSSIVGLSDKDSTLIKGSGADLSVYSHQPESSGSTKVVSMACRLLKEKGVYEFVEAAKIVTKHRSDVRFWLIGSVDAGNPNSVTQREVDNWQNKGIIEALGHRSDIAELFSQSNIVTMPSFYGEGVPKVLIEGAACGRPIVTTNNPGCRDAVIENETGLLVPVRDAEALATALFHLLDDDDLRVGMGKKAREFAVKEFDVNNVVANHFEIYESLMENRQS